MSAPGSSACAALARPGHERARARSRGARSGPLAVSPRSHDVKQRSVVRSRGALLRPGLSRLFACAFAFASAGEPTGLWRQRPSRQQQSRPPDEGGWSADRRTLSFGRACDARPPCPGRPGPLSALHRGGFRMRTHEAGSRQWDRSRSDCPRHATRPGGRGPDLPRCGSRRSVGRHSLLRLSGSFLENAPSEPGCESYTINPLRSQ